MISMPDHLNFPPALAGNDQHADSLLTSPLLPCKAIGYMRNHYIIFPPLLPYKTMLDMLHHNLNFVLSALRSNGLHARLTWFNFPPFYPTKQLVTC